MKSFIYHGFLLAVLIGIGSTDSVRVIRQQKDNPIYLNTTIDKGCYKSSNPLEDEGEHTWQSIGYCQRICVKSQKPVMAVSGFNCFCGDQLPRESDETTSDKCNTPCGGWPEDNLLGGKSSTSSSSSTQTSSSTNNNGGPTIVVTATGQPGKGPNKAGIAAGVVVGIVALGAIIGGGFFFMKYKKRKAVEEEYRRNATISSFVSGGKPLSSQQSSLSDSRLDQAMMSHRRQSNGSIADDQDFSRRILQTAVIINESTKELAHRSTITFITRKKNIQE
ncbi:WSC domain-containing protein [Histoplasma capsulatum var. duboisii H88]|uniref:WSC domain-containing protein n=2 Tax=Ajellomyces capsulatus TaxID=5037 RepID=F0U7E1_AJEC8|nr:WSC domain-containing protein [Histoplasma capsulatum H143]EGC42408.1 WSC domain-containing protein [Histoplasma capsulatum var. duboisii H88]